MRAWGQRFLHFHSKGQGFNENLPHAGGPSWHDEVDDLAHALVHDADLARGLVVVAGCARVE